MRSICNNDLFPEKTNRLLLIMRIFTKVPIYHYYNIILILVIHNTSRPNNSMVNLGYVNV